VLTTIDSAPKEMSTSWISEITDGENGLTNMSHCYDVRQVNGVKMADIMFSLFCMCMCVCVCALSPIGLNGRNHVLFAEKCIRLVREKLRIFPYLQFIVGIYVSLAI